MNKITSMGTDEITSTMYRQLARIQDGGFRTGIDEGIDDDLCCPDGCWMPPRRRTFVRDADCMANKIVASGGMMVPVTSDAFKNIQYQDSEIRWKTRNGYNGVRDMLYCHGVVLCEEADVPGWYKCKLPEGWRVVHEDAYGEIDRTELVHYVDRQGLLMFSLITYKSAKITTANFDNYC